MKANLVNANLEKANLKRANLRFADLTGANLNGADLHYAIFNEETLLPFSKEEAIKRGMLFEDSQGKIA